MAFNAKQQAAVLALFGVIATETYGLEREALRATEFVPMQSGLSPWLATFAYQRVTEVGVAKYIADYADDLPPVAKFMTLESIGIKPIGCSYAYSETELMQYLEHGIDVSRDKAALARYTIDTKVDKVILEGDKEQNVEGLVNNSNVTVFTSPIGAGGSSELKNKTYDEICETFRKWYDAGKRLNKGTIKLDTVLLPNEVYSYLALTNVSSSIDKSILDSLKEKFGKMGIVNWDSTESLDTAGAGGVGRGIMYRKNPTVLSYVLPIPFRQKDPQAQSLHYKVPCYARVGGTVIKNLKGIIYCDGL